MIIGCQKCNKKFEISSSLIPKNGRLLKCGSCNHEWFFIKQTNEKIITENNQINIDEINTESNNITVSLKNEEIEISPNTIEKEESKIEISPNTIEKEESKIEISPNTIEKEESEIKNKISRSDSKINKSQQKKISFFKILIVFIISIVSLILIADTFKEPISIIIPNIEFILYNLYETLKDIKLFFNDLY